MKLSLSNLAAIFSVIFILGFANYAEAATFNINTSKDTFIVGDQFNADIKINSEDVGINAAQATIKFSSAVLTASSAVSISSWAVLMALV